MKRNSFINTSWNVSYCHRIYFFYRCGVCKFMSTFKRSLYQFSFFFYLFLSSALTKYMDTSASLVFFKNVPFQNQFQCHAGHTTVKQISIISLRSSGSVALSNNLPPWTVYGFFFQYKNICYYIKCYFSVYTYLTWYACLFINNKINVYRPRQWKGLYLSERIKDAFPFN